MVFVLYVCVFVVVMVVVDEGCVCIIRIRQKSLYKMGGHALSFDFFYPWRQKSNKYCLTCSEAYAEANT